MSEARESLLNKYNKIFKNYFESSENGRKFPISWGLEIGDGWLPIIEMLCERIQFHVDWKQKSDPKFPQVEVLQCKEKFGGLRFYISGGDEYVNGLISMSEAICYRTCERCGVPASLRKDGWWRVTCDPCEELRKSGQPKYETSDETSGE